MKVALCFIISYEHILNKEQFWINWIKPNQDIINIYFHYKDVNMIKSPFIKAYSLPPKSIHPTTYFNVVPAYMSILSYAYHHDINNLWFCLLTDSCVPIISPEKFRKLFLEHYQASILKCKPAYWNITIHRRANLRLLNKEYWLANDPWFILTRSHVQKCLIFLAAKQGIYKKINDGGLANESIFAIILQTFKELNNKMTYINESSTIADWTRMSSPTSPHLFKYSPDQNKDIEIIRNLLKENKYAMFLRKVGRDFPEKILLEIMQEDFNHNYEILHNQMKQKKSIYKNQYYNYIITIIFCIIFIGIIFVI